MMFILLLLMIGAVASQSSYERQQTLCDRELAKAHSLYCYGIEHFPADSETVQIARPKPMEANDVVFIPEIPDRFTYRARRSTEARVRTDALIRACCLKPCHVAELLNHC